MSSRSKMIDWIEKAKKNKTSEYHYHSVRSRYHKMQAKKAKASGDKVKEMEHNGMAGSHGSIAQNIQKYGVPSRKNLDSTKIKKAKGPCWTGYKKVAGKKNYEKGSCEPVKKASDISAREKMIDWIAKSKVKRK